MVENANLYLRVIKITNNDCKVFSTGPGMVAVITAQYYFSYSVYSVG